MAKKYANRKKNFKVILPKTRYEAVKDKKISYSAAEVDTAITEDDVKRSEKDFKIYKNVRSYNEKLSRYDVERTVLEEGFTSIDEAIKRVDELVS